MRTKVFFLLQREGSDALLRKVVVVHRDYRVIKGNMKVLLLIDAVGAAFANRAVMCDLTLFVSPHS